MITKKISGAEKKRIIAILSCFSDSLDEIIFFAFRYFMGRMTIATGVFARDLAKSWPLLSERVREMIEWELEKAFRDDDEERLRQGKTMCTLGMDCDRAAWELVRKSYTEN